MAEYIGGNPFLMQILIENMLVSSGAIRLLKDGGASDSKIYTRQYELCVKGKPTGIRVKFTYNLRDDWADVSLPYYRLVDLKFRQLTEGIRNDRIQVYEVEGNREIRARDEEAVRLYGSKESQRFFNRLKEGKGQSKEAK